MNKLLTVNNLSKTYHTLSGEIQTINNINFEINEGEFVAIVGSSGCGKSTLLNILANIDKDYKGEISYKDCKIGYMLQQDALLPWLTVIDNILIGKKIGHNINDNYVLHLLKKYNLNEFKNKTPNNLSGGMKQRVALIRTLATNPKLLLLDEPFSALDYQTRLMIENDIYNIIKNEGKTAILVTHDISEAVAMADRVILLSKRPASIKKIYNIKLNNKTNPIDNRNDERFNYYVNLIWKDLDNNVA